MSNTNNTPKLVIAIKKKTQTTKSKKLADFGEAEPVAPATTDLPSQQQQQPLVIPKLDNHSTWSIEDREAAEALQLKIQHASSTTDPLMIEARQYQTQVETLPDAPALDSDAYRSVPIAEFGAAMLRGMGWQGEKDAQQDAPSLPRPHRLGLGAVPSAPKELGRAGRRSQEQMQRNAALQEQQAEYERERERQLLKDKQRRLQNGSIVWIGQQRARLLQLVGVPGLNMVKIQWEGVAEPSVVKRGEIGSLVERDQLLTKPFVQAEPAPTRANKEPKEASREKQPETKKKNERKRQEESQDEPCSKKRRRRDQAASWVVPGIRVRIVTEKLGRRHFKQKGVVVDVTTKGATVQLPGALLDHVPERYLETALPKVGGRCMVLAGEHCRTKGRLLERSKSSAVIQAYEDMNVLTLSLDDLAEWCGPLDDDEDMA